MTRTIEYKFRPRLLAAASVAGKKEGDGPLGPLFDQIEPDDLFGQDSWEKAESAMLIRTVNLALEKGGVTAKSIGAVLMGDLLNQIVASSFAARELGSPFIGLYGACSTMIEGILIGGALVDAGYIDNCVCAASSHFCSAERQYRFPLELGNQRPPSAQWTTTAAGAVVMDRQDGNCMARLTHATIGRVVDYSIKDVNHMGAAMAPAVADTLTAHFSDTGRSHEDYDLIVTGDLGIVGRKIFCELISKRGFNIPEDKIFDCGANMFYPEQDTQSGGSGCGCIASVLAAKILPMLNRGEAKRVLAIGSGAMLSPTSSGQGESIPGIAYGAALEAER
ncbi:MAG: stage V sporulation protein AD [Clostridia bacterium]|nr:stage V sporulation protein AD [Clostridia bacterium]